MHVAMKSQLRRWRIVCLGSVVLTTFTWSAVFLSVMPLHELVVYTESNLTAEVGECLVVLFGFCAAENRVI